jgi:disulfide bond formation protein DsbB
MRFLTTIISLLILLIFLCACSDNSQAAQAGAAGEGQQLFLVYCGSCHGPNGEGIASLGKPLTTSEFAGSLSDEELLEFIKAGRPANDPLNTSGILMPPKGGNPALTDEQLMDIIAYIRSIQTY